MNKITREKFLSIIGTATAGFAWFPTGALSISNLKKDNKMYGLIGKITAKANQRDELIKILLNGSADMPGCLNYIVSKDSVEDDIIWITEVWESKEKHKSSLSLPGVQEAMAQGRPLIEKFDKQVEIEPVGGQGLASK